MEDGEVKKRKGPSASYQKARREAIKAGTWNPRFRRTQRRIEGQGMSDDRSSLPGPSSEAASGIPDGG
jgi:hypothetical protein